MIVLVLLFKFASIASSNQHVLQNFFVPAFALFFLGSGVML